MDYEGITAPLPADYSIDGEHFWCRYDLWQARRGPLLQRALTSLPRCGVECRPCRVVLRTVSPEGTECPLPQDRVSYPYPCKGLANTVAANLIANAACNDIT